MAGGIQYIKNISRSCVQFVVYPLLPSYITSHQRAGLSREKAEDGELLKKFNHILYVAVLLMCDNNIYCRPRELVCM